jgi:hypothetical protein
VLEVSARVVRVAADDLETQALIELRGLEAMRVEHHLATSARDGFTLGRYHQSLAVPPLAHILPHPQVANFARGSPCPSVESRDDLSAIVSDQKRQDSAIGDPGGLDVVLIDAIVEEMDFCVGWILIDCGNIDS